MSAERNKNSAKSDVSTNIEDELNSAFTGIMLCGGRGSRLGGPLPKSLMPVYGQALMDYSVYPLYRAGVKKFVFATAYQSEKVKEHIHNQPYSGTAQIFEEAEPTGPISGLKLALSHFNITGATAILTSDAVIEGLDFTQAYKYHKEHQANITLVSTRSDQPKHTDYVLIKEKMTEEAAVIFRKEDQKVEKPITLCGMIICSSKATGYIGKLPENISQSWIDVIARLSVVGRTFIYESPLLYANVNKQEDLQEIELLMAKRHESN